MLVLKQQAKQAECIPYGSVANLGAEVLAGDPQAKGAELVGKQGDAQIVGVFGCSEGTFKVEHTFAEHATLVEGRITLTDVKTGTSQTFEAGDSWFIQVGEVIEWQLHTPMLKHYLAIF